MAEIDILKVKNEEGNKFSHDLRKKVETEDYDGITQMIENRVKDEQERSIQPLAEAMMKEIASRMPEPQRKDILGDPDPQEKKASGFKDFGEYIKAVVNVGQKQGFDPRLKALAEGAGADGGYTVPREFLSQMEKTALESAVMRNAGPLVITAGRSNTIDLPLFKDTAHDTNLFGGFIAYWGGEASAMTETSPKIDSINLRLNKLYLFTYASQELLDDNAVGLESILQSKGADVIG